MGTENANTNGKALEEIGKRANQQSPNSFINHQLSN